MINEFNELKERVCLVNDDINSLTQIVADYIDSGLDGAARPTPLRDTFDLYIVQKSPVPVLIKSRVGTITNELRACLDALAVYLAIRNGRNEKDVYFPISKSKEIFETDGRKKIKKLSEVDQNTIAQLNPYRGGHQWLWPLHEIDRKRKHIRLSAFTGTSTKVVLGDNAHLISGNAKVWIQCSNYGGVYIDDMEVNTGRINDKETEQVFAIGVPKGLKVQAEYALGFLEPEELHNQSMIGVLTKFAKAVHETIELFN
jgi:hypothetical protein